METKTKKDGGGKKGKFSFAPAIKPPAPTNERNTAFGSDSKSKSKDVLRTAPPNYVGDQQQRQQQQQQRQHQYQPHRPSNARQMMPGDHLAPASNDDDETIATIDRPGAHRMSGTTGGTTVEDSGTVYDPTGTGTTSADVGDVEGRGGGGDTQNAQEHLVTAYLVEEDDEDKKNGNNKTGTDSNQGLPRRWVFLGAGAFLVALLIVLLVVLVRPSTDNAGSSSNNSDTMPSSAASQSSPAPSAATPKPTSSPTSPPTLSPGPTASPTAQPIEWELTELIIASNASGVDSAFGRSLSLSGTGQVIAIGGRGQVHTYFDAEGDGTFDDDAQPFDNAHFITPPGVFIPSPSFGYTVELSNDGFYMAVGEPDNGRVHILFFDGGGWSPDDGSPVAQEMTGDAGIALAFAREAKTVVAVGNDSNRVQVYAKENNVWNIRGAAFIGTEIGKSDSIGLSDNGDVLAIGDPTADPQRQGLVQVLQWDSDLQTWDRLGNDIPGLSPDSRFGRSVALSGNGQVVAGGANFADVLGTNSNSGHIRVFEWTGNPHDGDLTSTDGEWIQRGDTLFFPSEFQAEFGRYIELNNDGTVLMASTPFPDDSAGQVDVFYYENGEWIQRGSKLEGNPNDDRGSWRFGYALAMTPDGSMIATSRTDGEHRLCRKDRQLQSMKKTMITRGGKQQEKYEEQKHDDIAAVADTDDQRYLQVDSSFPGGTVSVYQAVPINLIN